jgi:hypothetical protein
MNFKSLVLLAMTGFVFMSCAKINNVVLDANLKSYVIEEDMWVDADATVNLGKLSLGAIDLPIVNPRNKERVFGQIVIKPRLDSTTSDISLKVNISEIAMLPATDLATLPNGAELPVAGIDGQKIVELEIDQIRSKVYIGISENMAILGFAVVIKQLDRLDGAVQNLFFRFNVKEVVGVVGLFASKEEKQSGLGFFVDLSDIISREVMEAIMAGEPVIDIYSYDSLNPVSIDERMDSDVYFNNSYVEKRDLRRAKKAIRKMKYTRLNYVEK